MQGIEDIFGIYTRPEGPRTYKHPRQRIKPQIVGNRKGQYQRGMESGSGEPEESGKSQSEDLIDRDTLCLPDFAQNDVVHGGDGRFGSVARQYFQSSESNATERLVQLKTQLREASTYDFWGLLMEEMCDITGAQCGFVAKRMLVDDQDSAVEMPPLGEPGSCLMGVAFYVNNGADVKNLRRDYRYHAYGTPCAYMKHDKVFVIPERMNEFIPDNPNEMPWKQSEAFIGVPLFSEGMNFAHFGLIWSSEGASKRKLGWTFIEMFLHSLEDMILKRILEGRGFAKPVDLHNSAPAKVIPLSAITATQSLQPYARNLSHELRTPMQGVIGMLDIMHSTVLDAISNQSSDKVREIFINLRNHIETVQDSSKRAVEAADNVVHAYDLNMEMPETSLPSKSTNVPPLSIAPVAPQTPIADTPMFLLPASSKRGSPDADDCHSGRPRKRMFTITEAEILRRYYPDEAISSCGVCGVVVATDDPKIISPALDRVTPEDTPVIVPATLSPGHRKLVTRTFLRDLMHEALERVHPSKEVHTETELGEMVEITTNDWREEVHDKVVFLSVEASVPEVIIIEEIHLKFALQRILDNAIKFTDNGRIEITVKMARSPQLVEIRVADTGCGIAQEAKSQIFKPHFQEDASIRRSRDGLGLSLFNAKAHVRKSLGGDLTLERSATEGPTKGSEFLLRIPISTFNLVSLDATLIKTPPNGTFAVADISASLPSPSGPFTIPTNADPGEDKMVPSGPASRPVVARKRINSQLAKQYPLNVLIAEDNDTNRKILIKTLERLGYLTDKVAVAVDGVEAVNHYEACLSKPKQERFDLILMDIWMPNMDGFEASTRILDLAQKNGEAPRIMAVTADITGDCLTKSQKIGMGFLPKPYKALEIEGIIIELFQATGEAACE